MEQKIIKVGNSLGVTLPKNFTKATRLQAGEKIFVEADPELNLVQIRTKGAQRPLLTPEFKEWLDRISSQYSQTIKELAKR